MNVYDEMSVTIGEYSYDLYVVSEEDLDSLVSAAGFLGEQNSGISFTVDLFVAFDYGEGISDELQGGTATYSYAFEKGYLILIFLAD